MFSPWYIYWPVVLIFFGFVASFDFLFTLDFARFAAFPQVIHPGCKNVQEHWHKKLVGLGQTRVRGYCIGAGTSPDTTGLMSSVAMMSSKRVKKTCQGVSRKYRWLRTRKCRQATNKALSLFLPRFRIEAQRSSERTQQIAASKTSKRQRQREGEKWHLSFRWTMGACGSNHGRLFERRD
ncbi:uncharacterized protein B0T23DRAFT_383277 [Neurospora hispaniola]|uniref:Uncharacterized protein n=1 Tax=Neurospora hispaniola TaxID=588809 RepID=A0AAJ0MR58_9PEZI|nr:hypothetical protein B0T23DRAFT_383277 [Neurospora hispaniola]